MTLNKEDKIKILATLDLFKDKLEISKDSNEVIYKWQDGDTIDDKLDEIDTKDEELLKHLADRVFSFVKNYPKLMRELKEKYFKTL